MSTPGADPTQQPSTPPDAHGSGNAGTPQPPVPEDKKFSQADLEAAISARLKRERDAHEAKTAREKEAADLERQKQQGEWQAVAQTHQSRATELEAVSTQQASQIDAYDKALTTRLKAEIADWPQEAKDALPKEADALELAEAVERIRPLVGKLAATGQTARTPGAPAGPRPAGASPGGKDAEYERLKATGRYRI